MTEEEKAILVSINSAKGVGYVEGMRAVKQKPLSDGEIMKLLNGIEYSQAEVETSFDYEIRIARAIEERHGIK